SVIVAGGTGVVLTASFFSYAGLGLAAAVTALLAWRCRTLTLRRLVALGAVMVVVGAGVVGLRGSDISDYLGFLGFHKAPAQMTHIATGPQRTMLAYIGLRIWADHPWLGVGFE